MNIDLKNIAVVVVILGVLATLSGCEKPKIEDQDISPGVMIDEAKPKWRVDAANGDLNAAYALAIWDSTSNTDREKKLINIAEKGQPSALMDLCHAYAHGALLGIKKDCVLARKWCAEAEKAKLNLSQHAPFSLDKECPQ